MKNNSSENESFKNMVIEECKYFYPKDKKGVKTGHTIAVLVRGSKVFFGEAICSPEDNFNKKIGRMLSSQRALESYLRSSEATSSEDC